MMRRLLDKARLSLLRALLPKDEKLKEEVAKLWLPRSSHSIWLGWDDVDMGGKRIRRVGTPIEDEDVARKKDVEQAGMPVGEAGDMIYHDGEKWTALKAPAEEKWLKHPGAPSAPVWADLPALAPTLPRFVYLTFFDSSDGMHIYTSGSGEARPGSAGLTLKTGTTANSVAFARKIIERFSSETEATLHPIITPSKKPVLRTVAAPNRTTERLYLVVGNMADASGGFGFLFESGTLYGWVKVPNQAATTTNLMAYSAYEFYELEAKLTPDGVDFYVNGELKGSISPLPDGFVDLAEPMYARAENPGGTNLMVFVQYWMLTQEM